MRPAPGFSHEALFYGGDVAFVDATAPLVRQAVSDGDTVIVAVPTPRLDALRSALPGAGDGVEWLAMEQVGRNPGRLIDLWHDLLADDSVTGRPILGIGEPVFMGRTEPELAECVVHEHLLNEAFADQDLLRLICPYDAAALDAEVIADARATHPVICNDAAPNHSHVHDASAVVLEMPLPPPPVGATQFAIGAAGLPELRRAVHTLAGAVGLHDVRRRDDLILALSEIAANTVVHGGESGTLRAWDDGTSLWCEVSNEGRIQDPMVGRRRPPDDQPGGRGVWIAHQLCDLVQVRSSAGRTTVRIRMDLDGRRGADHR